MRANPNSEIENQFILSVMTNSVFLFGRLVEIIGSEKISMENISDTHSLKSQLEERFPALRNCQYVFAVNRKICNENCKINTGDEISLLPPFAGG